MSVETKQVENETVTPPSFGLSVMRPILPWLIGFAVLLPLPTLLPNAYHQYVVDVIAINVILAVGLNIVKGFAGQVTEIASLGAGPHAQRPLWKTTPHSGQRASCGGLPASK